MGKKFHMDTWDLFFNSDLKCEAGFCSARCKRQRDRNQRRIFHARGSDTGALTLDLSYGKYLTPGWEAGLRQAFNVNFIDDARDVWTATTTPFLRYNIPLTENIVPFAGGFLGLVWNDRDATGTLGPNAGAKFFFNDQTYFTTAYRYEWFFDSIKTASNSRTDANHVLNFGIGFVWGGARN